MHVITYKLLRYVYLYVSIYRKAVMDLFAGIDGLSGSNTAKLSLEEQRKAKETQNRQIVNAFEDISLLGSAGSAGSSDPFSSFTSTAPPKASALTTNSSNPADDDIFGIFSSAPAVPASSQTRNTPPSVSKPPVESRNTDLRDYDHHEPRQTHQTQRSGSSSRGQSSLNSNASSRLEAERHGRNSPTSSLNTVKSAVSSNSTVSSSGSTQSAHTSRTGYVTDKSISVMMEMGFEPEDAARALEAMHGNVHGAINWLMAEAQGLPLPKPRTNVASTDFNDLQTAASQIGSSMFSKASKLFSKGRKEIEKIYNDYSNAAGADSEHPAWMKEKGKYDAKFKNDDVLPQRPRPKPKPKPMDPPLPPRNVTSEKPSSSSSSEPKERARGSRAEAFRQLQKQRQEQKMASAATSSAPAQSSDPVSLVDTFDSNIASSQPSQSAQEPSVAEADIEIVQVTEEIDLLNLDASSRAPASNNLSSTQTDLFTDSREAGTDCFKKGSYDDAVINYTKALEVLPENHILSTVILSNRAAAHLKNGNSQSAFDDTVAALKLIPGKGANMEIEGKKMSDLWMKLVTRNAQAAENMEKFDIALKSWQLLLDNGYFTPSILDSKRRCVKALDIHKNGPPVNNKPKPTTKRRGWGTMGATPTSEEGKAAVAKVKDLHEKQKQEETERDNLRDVISKRIDQWKNGKEGNLRALLSSLEKVLWADSNWKPVSASDLVVPKKVRMIYMRAVARTHPDKIGSNASTEIKMTSQAVFIAVQDAWDIFRKENNM